jgi:hypothetical protein
MAKDVIRMLFLSKWLLILFVNTVIRILYCCCCRFPSGDSQHFIEQQKKDAKSYDIHNYRIIPGKSNLLVKTHLEYYNEHKLNLGLNIVFFFLEWYEITCYTGHVSDIWC